jgi:hypothetical protein
MVEPGGRSSMLQSRPFLMSRDQIIFSSGAQKADSPVEGNRGFMTAWIQKESRF